MKFQNFPLFTAGEELKKLRLSTDNSVKLIRCQNTAINKQAKERSLSLTLPESSSVSEPAQMQLNNYYYYQRMSPYFRKLYNLPISPNVNPFSFQAQESMFQNFLSVPTISGAQNTITRSNSSAVNCSLNISSLNNLKPGHHNN